MENEVSGIKCEAPQFCHACFSVNRTLWPVGNLLEIFYTLLGNPDTHTALEQPCLCWECLALLSRARRFREKAAAVQAYLRRCQFEQNVKIPAPLTRLTTALYVTDSSSTGFECMGALAGSPLDDIKEEPPHFPGPLLDALMDLKQEADDGLNTDDDWPNDDFDTKDTITEPPKGDSAKASKKYKPRRLKYIKGELCIEKFFTKVPIDDIELQRLLAQDRTDKSFLKLPYRCEICLCGWKDEQKMHRHNKAKHSQRVDALECAVCGARLAHKSGLTRHMSAHYRARQCAACEYRCVGRGHLRRHVLKWHLKTVMCQACGAFFHNVRDFFAHHRVLHSQYLCDHCGKRCVTRRAIKKHLRKHGPFICLLCDGRSFKSQSTLSGHKALVHAPAPPRPELAYCVECDRQFPTIVMFRRHLANAVQHRKITRKKQIPCPACGKMYARKQNMRAHYNLVHLNRSDFQCRECDLMFLNRTKYVYHMQRKHEAGYQQPRNKLCAHCGRGFSTNRILQNHMRTHTGERPYACAHCNAKFGQEVALKTHVKHIHLKIKRQPAQPLKFFQTC